MKEVFKQRFEELEEQASQLESSKKVLRTEIIGGTNEVIDSNLLLSWKVKVKNLLSKVCGEDSQHFKQFQREENRPRHTTYGIFNAFKAVFLAAKEDFEGGYLSSIKTLVQAEVFDSELEQANELFSSGYHTAAAVIAGVVLETALRELCDRSGIPHGKLDKMNSELAKAGVYNKLNQKRITAIADIRNSAAHGKQDEFTVQDVSDMIKDVGRFLADYLVD
ncbi:DUF4145 domain-containing protein [Microcystis aeruginosa BLCCF108]|uniref:DUF4145 domain-containing protein n=1 Tax=Microcystis aeruginosa BLCC-F108 TaxID=2755317 RepID=A0A841UQF1_MICAE|nr:DUF4145 domain-containing protein [Microcystis aeruginosa BLCC-F108]MCA2590359.1 DUF4145 domain-containing protein [Microcystis sp. M31BS1]